jgi:AraC-like DNA-binding protein
MKEAVMLPMAPCFSVTTEDINVAARLGNEMFYPQRFEAIGGSGRFTMTLHAGQLGSVFLADLTLGTDVRIDCGELTTSYHVNIPVRGSLRSQHGGVATIATPDRATVYGPTGRTVLTRWETGSRQLCVKIDKCALEAALSESVGHLITEPVNFDPTLDVRVGAGRSWAELVFWLNAQMRQRASLFHQPLVAVALAESVVTGLISAAGFPGRGHREEPHATCSSPVITQAIELINERTDEPLTTAAIAADCCISVRALQEGFQKHIGQSPTGYLRTVRLRRAHYELLAANPFKDSVATIAHRWGFAHLGRFAASHYAEYGEAPSRTLRRGV